MDAMAHEPDCGPLARLIFSCLSVHVFDCRSPGRTTQWAQDRAIVVDSFSLPDEIIATASNGLNTSKMLYRDEFS